MPQEKLTFDNYLQRVYPPRSVKLRHDRGFIWKTAKWLGIRTAYVLYRLGLTANLIDAIGLLLALLAFIFMLRARNGDILLAAIGILLIYFHMLIDFVDGSVARARGEASSIGHEYDEIGCEIDRVLLLAVLGIYSQNNYIIIMNVFVGCFIFNLVQPTFKLIPDRGILRQIKKLYIHPFSLNSVRIMLGILPAVLWLFIYFGANLAELSIVISFAYALLSLAWLMMSVSIRIAPEMK